MVFICRLCGKCENESSGLAIFGEQGVKEALAYKIKLSLDISVYEYDPLPKYICECCLGKLFTTFAFQESCRRTQILLRERFLMSKNWSPNETTSTIELEQLLHPTEHGVMVDAIPECNLHSSEDALLPCIIEETHMENNNEIDVKHEDSEIIGLEKDVLTPGAKSSDSQQQHNSGCAELSSLLISNIRTEENNRNGMLQEFVMVIDGKDCGKSNSGERKKKEHHSGCSTQGVHGKNQNANNILQKSRLLLNEKKILSVQNNNLRATAEIVSNMDVIEQSVNESNVHASSSSGVESNEALISEIAESCTNGSIESLSETLSVEEQDAIDDVYIGPDLYETPQTISLVDVDIAEQQTTLPQIAPQGSELVDLRCNNSLKIVDVFSVHEVTNAPTPTSFMINASNNSNMNNWHSPSPPASQSNSFSSSSQIPSMNASDKTKWHSPSPQSSEDPVLSYSPALEKNLQNTSKKNGLGSMSTMNSITRMEEEDDILVVEVVKANKGSIAQHWENYFSGFRCKLCNKTYKKLVKCENHIRIHLGIKPYECHVCKRRYHKKRLLNEHCIYHTGKKLYQCTECDKSFRYRKNFKSHVETHVEGLNSSYLCEICNKSFKSQFEYWSHKTSKHIITNFRTVVVE